LGCYNDPNRQTIFGPYPRDARPAGCGHNGTKGLRGNGFCRKLVAEYNVYVFDSLVTGHGGIGRADNGVGRGDRERPADAGADADRGRQDAVQMLLYELSRRMR
jgi:hypothetical protein